MPAGPPVESPIGFGNLPNMSLHDDSAGWPKAHGGHGHGQGMLCHFAGPDLLPPMNTSNPRPANGAGSLEVFSHKQGHSQHLSTRGVY